MAAVQAFLDTYPCTTREEATHVAYVPDRDGNVNPTFLSVPEDDAGQTALADIVHQGNTEKWQVAWREFTTPVFAAHFDMVLQGGDANGKKVSPEHLSKLTKETVLALLSHCYSEKTYLAVLMYAMRDGTTMRAQVVFPDLLVSGDRIQALRQEVIRRLSSKTDLVDSLLSVHTGNTLTEVFQAFAPRTAIAVPLSRTATGPLSTIGDTLELRKQGRIYFAPPPQEVADPPLEGANIIRSGLKRRDPRSEFNALTQWKEPEATQKGGTGSGRGTSSSGETPSTAATGGARGRGRK